MANYIFPSDLGSRQQGHFMKIFIEPSPVGTAQADRNTIMLFIPGGPQNGPMNWTMVHEYDDVKLTKLGMGAIGGFSRIPEAAIGAARIAGQGTINPKVDVLYGNSQLRVFQFSFFMAPQSERESRTLREIVKLLRKYSAPEIGTPSGARYATGLLTDALTAAGAPALFTGTSGQGSQMQSGLWFIPPAEFIVKFYSMYDLENGGRTSRENPYLPKIGRCVLTRVEVDYGQNSDFSTFKDGSPTNLQLTLVFREMRVISQTDVEDGY